MKNNSVDYKMCVFIFANYIRNEEKNIMKELDNLGIDTQIFLPRNNRQYTFKKDGIPKLAIMRYLSSEMAISKSEILEAFGSNVVNNSNAIKICSNKILQSVLFSKNGLPCPKFEIAYSINDIFNFSKINKSEFIIKPINSSWGRGITRVVNEQCLNAWVAGRESLDPNEKSFPLLIQEFIPKDNYDIRVIIVGDKPICAYKRLASNWKTNVHLGAKVQPIKINKKIESIVSNACKIIGKGIYGLDIIENKYTGVNYICEVNATPEFFKSSKIHGINVGQEIAIFLAQKLKDTSKEVSSHLRRNLYNEKL